MPPQIFQEPDPPGKASEPTGAGEQTEIACVFGNVSLTRTQHEVLCSALTHYNFQLGEFFPPDEVRLQASRDLESIFHL